MSKILFFYKPGQNKHTDTFYNSLLTSKPVQHYGWLKSQPCTELEVEKVDMFKVPEQYKLDQTFSIQTIIVHAMATWD